MLPAQVAKDDRSDIESSSDEEIYSSGSKNPTQTIKAKHSSHTGNVNGEAHDHWVLRGNINPSEGLIYLVRACVTSWEDPLRGF